MIKNHEAMLRTGAMALAAAGASTAAHAANVQITFNNSFISTSSGTATLDTDFGGDNVDDVVGIVIVTSLHFGISLWTAGESAGIGNGYLARGFPSGGNGFALVRDGGAMVAGATAVSSGLVAFTLVDASVRSGAPTAGWVDVTATWWAADARGRVNVDRFVFDDTTGLAPVGVAHADPAYREYVAAVPEPSGLGLLALGASGLLARRRRAMAA